MKTRTIFTALTILAAGIATAAAQPRTVTTLKSGWEFRRGEKNGDGEWTKVTIPHDWAIYGPFDRSNDLQTVAVIQNGEREESVKTGRSGGLPYVGKGGYRLDLPIINKGDRRFTLLFDGAMSGAQVFVNGTKCGGWAYGYNSFAVDITDAATEGSNLVEVELENLPQSSRWYPGAGLYRNVHLIATERIHVPVWGTQITTPYVGGEYASVCLRTEINNLPDGEMLRIATVIRDADGRTVAAKDDTRKVCRSMPFEQHFTVDSPRLWSPESPTLYTAESKIYHNGRLTDEYTTRFGIRTVVCRGNFHYRRRDVGILLYRKVEYRDYAEHHYYYGERYGEYRTRNEKPVHGVISLSESLSHRYAVSVAPSVPPSLRLRFPFRQSTNLRKCLPTLLPDIRRCCRGV